VEELQQ
jgi:hypothetical protein